MEKFGLLVKKVIYYLRRILFLFYFYIVLFFLYFIEIARHKNYILFVIRFFFLFIVSVFIVGCFVFFVKFRFFDESVRIWSNAPSKVYLVFISFFILFVSYCVYFFDKKYNKTNKEEFTQKGDLMKEKPIEIIFKDCDLKSTMLCYHKIFVSYFNIMKQKGDVSREEFEHLMKSIFLNVIALYSILEKENSLVSIKIVKEYRDFIEKEFNEQKDSFDQISYIVMLSYCDTLLEILEEKKKNKEKMQYTFKEVLEKVRVSYAKIFSQSLNNENE